MHDWHAEHDVHAVFALWRHVDKHLAGSIRVESTDCLECSELADQSVYVACDSTAAAVLCKGVTSLEASPASPYKMSFLWLESCQEVRTALGRRIWKFSHFLRVCCRLSYAAGILSGRNQPPLCSKVVGVSVYCRTRESGGTKLHQVQHRNTCSVCWEEAPSRALAV
jgi:hypothetical protein